MWTQEIVLIIVIIYNMDVGSYVDSRFDLDLYQHLPSHLLSTIIIRPVYANTKYQFFYVKM